MAKVTAVTGGAGFIGSHLVDRLAASGRAVRVIERPGAPVDHLPPSVDVARADIRDRAQVRRALQGTAEVYHLAANPNLWVRDRVEFERVNHLGTVHALDEAIRAGAERILHCSTESILTKAHQQESIREDVEISELDAAGPYCLSKLRAEWAALERARAGHPVFVANPTMPVGPGDRGISPPTRLILDFCQGRLPAVLDCVLNLVDVRDVAEGMVRVLERGEPGRRYLLGGENLRLVALLERLSTLTGRPVPNWRVPRWLAFVVAWTDERRANWLGGAPPKATVTGVRLACRSLRFDASATHESLGLVPRPIHDSLADALSWLEAQGQLPPRTARRIPPGEDDTASDEGLNRRCSVRAAERPPAPGSSPNVTQPNEAAVRAGMKS